MKGINNQTAVKQAFLDMKPEILKKRECENSPYDYDNWVAGQSHVYTKESRYLNKKL
tara:strand:- start:56 stop:226 length:171 start_codon:yes stop_codon:yes gene_type:complete